MAKRKEPPLRSTQTILQLPHPGKARHFSGVDEGEGQREGVHFRGEAFKLGVRGSFPKTDVGDQIHRGHSAEIVALLEVQNEGQRPGVDFVRSLCISNQRPPARARLEARDRRRGIFSIPVVVQSFA